MDNPCTCAADGNARRCPHHTQEDFDAADRARDTLLPLENGHPVIAAETWINRDGIGEGIVLAQCYGGDLGPIEWVTWHVYRHVGQTEWVAEHGDYHHDLDQARAAYDERRAETRKPWPSPRKTISDAIGDL